VVQVQALGKVCAVLEGALRDVCADFGEVLFQVLAEYFQGLVYLQTVPDLSVLVAFQ
jgi:hypothetical protein